jgi:hypothetical protein
MKSTSQRRSFLRFSLKSLAFAFLLCFTTSSAIAQDDPNTISREVAEQTITFDSVNPYTKAAGKMTIVFSGVFNFTTAFEDAQSGTSRVAGAQVGTFTFVPDDPSQPPVSGGFRFRLAGRTQPRSNEVHFGFSMAGVAQDGTRFTFVQIERALIKEDGLEISFGETRAFGQKEE